MLIGGVGEAADGIPVVDQHDAHGRACPSQQVDGSGRSRESGPDYRDGAHELRASVHAAPLRRQSIILPEER